MLLIQYLSRETHRPVYANLLTPLHTVADYCYYCTKHLQYMGMDNDKDLGRLAWSGRFFGSNVTVEEGSCNWETLQLVSSVSFNCCSIETDFVAIPPTVHVHSNPSVYI